MKCRNRKTMSYLGARVCWAILWAGAGACGTELTSIPNTNPPPASVTLAEAQRFALERNWDLLAAAVGVDAATAQKIVAHEFPNPTFTIDTFKIGIAGTSSSTPEGNGVWQRSYDTIFAINQLFEIGGKRRDRQVSAQAGYESARAQFFEAKRTLDLAIAKAYVAAAQAQENVGVLRQSAETLRQEAQIADVRFKAGEISSSDKSQIEITAERFELDAKAAETAAAQARVTLEVPMGLSQPKGELALSERLELLSAQAAPPATNLWGIGRPDVLAAEAATRKAEADWRLQRAMRVPDPSVLAQYEHEPPDSLNTVGFGVSFPLPLWNRNRGNIQAAQAAREQARLAYEKACAQAAADIAIARMAYEDAVRRWQSYRESIRPKSEQVRKTLAYAYQKGGASLLDMLVAERNDNEVRLAAMQAASDAAAALASLKAATQVIEASQLKK
jgi:outer membrane protein, heavy metal efflux system